MERNALRNYEIPEGNGAVLEGRRFAVDQLDHVHAELAPHRVTHFSHLEGVRRFLKSRHHGSGPEVSEIATQRPAPGVLGVPTGERLEGLPPGRPVLQLDRQGHDAVDLRFGSLAGKGQKDMPGPN